MKTFVIHYKPLKNRRKNISKQLNKIDIEAEFITDFDRESLDISNEKYYQDPIIWNNQLITIKKILIKNLIKNKSNFTLKKQIYWRMISLANRLIIPKNFQYRKLKSSEISLILKHHSALKKIQKLKSPALILEDDIILKPESKYLINKAYELCKKKYDYIDLGGGCNLPLFKKDVPEINNERFINLKIPRSRTTAAYMVTPQTASKLCDNIFPIVMPLDWQYQYIFIKKGIKVSWINPPAFIHGSENKYKSSIRN